MIGKAMIAVVGGKGGKGSAGFRREKFVPKGGPDGGDGGRGGSVYVVGVDGLSDLGHMRYRRLFEGEGGVDGGSGKRYGKAGKDILVETPVGTVVWEVTQEGENRLMGEVLGAGERVLVAEGGAGGRGNVKFASSTNKVPYLAEVGDEGEGRDLYLEHWPLVDIALVSLPNAGKSQLLQAFSNAIPMVTEYPFSTKDYVLGVVEVEWTAFTAMEVPSLCDGAHEGRGLGNDFLTSVMRAKLLLYLIDGLSLDPLADLAILREEIRLYDDALAQRSWAIVVTKNDLPEVQERMAELQRLLGDHGEFCCMVSGLTGAGVDELKANLARMLESLPPGPRRQDIPPPIKRIRVQETRPQVMRLDDVFVVDSPRAARLVAGSDLRVFRARLQLRRELDKMGVLQALRDAGVKSGDAVRIGNVELEWE
ncbi:MAG: GTPase ObgE [Chloroflexi bacterium]|nr:GTPase ObgE [Chloroflexota bacterium]